ncbi:NADPH-dependent ferric siderophore reductase [Kitasatospora sp. MAA19]|uniref:siderophore-interacting protein n=1 Tax=unclassified Kitasatospora TaxID=2633591 RepID=UPI002474C510|nr:siderophore-interacting protein [Kitasatospora sp. MAA19]MDH6708830.1 NADPH-dependent ferric siderophore reductase [Kitasatospora sp. MAA19]
MTLPVTFVEVVEVRRITPRTARVTFEAGALADSVGVAPDQQVKLCFPRPGQAEPELPAQSDDPMSWYQAYLAIPEAARPLLRSFTLRRRRPGTRLVEIDFVLHGDSGPAAAWADRAAPGQRLGMVGPSALYAPTVPFAEAAAAADWVLLAGDETALPAIATLVAALPAGVRAVAFVEVADEAERQPLESGAELAVHWLTRCGRAPGEALVGAVRAAGLPGGTPFAWLAGEAGAVRALRRQLVEERGVPKSSIDFTGYWRHRLTQDDAPTAEDLADAQERFAAS